MKFMFIARFKDSFYALSPERQQELMGGAAQHGERWAKEGKLKGAYSLGNMKGWISLYDLDSSEDLAGVLSEGPLLPFVDMEITPLIEMDVAMKAQAKK